MKFFAKYRDVLTPEERNQRKKERLLALLSGVLLGISFPPFPFPFLIFFALIPFFFAVEKRESLAGINRITYLTHFVFTLITLYWVGSWTKEADPFLMISGVLLMFVNPALYLIPTTLYFLAKKSLNKKAALFLFPFFWSAFEYLYGLTDLRFPWLMLSNSLVYFNSFIQIADIIGAPGLLLVVLFINIFLFLFMKNRKEEPRTNLKYVWIAALLFVVPLVYGIVRLNTYMLSDKKIKVGLVQPDLDPWDKWEAGNISEQLELYLSLSERAVKQKAEIIIWPESALPAYLLSDGYYDEVNRIHRFADTNNVFVLTGMPDATFFFNKEEAPPDAKFTKLSGTPYVSYNSILLFSPNSRHVQKYGKIKLVPFGERVPFVDKLPFLGDLIKWQVGISSWNVGREQTVFDLDKNHDLKIGGLVCIESIYPDFTAGFVQKGANIIAVVTNDSWYGYSSGPFQHKEISVLRAIENRRMVLRAANGGVSCFIDPLGRTIEQTKLFTRDLLVSYAYVENGLTFYSRNPLIIPLASSIISLMIIIFFIYKRIRARLTKNETD